MDFSAFVADPKFVAYVVGGVGAVGFAVAAYMGVFRSVEVTQGEFPASHFIAASFRGEYKNIGGLFGDVHRVFGHLTEEEPRIRVAGIYYDDPDEMQDKSKCRALAGVLVPRPVFARLKEEFGAIVAQGDGKWETREMEAAAAYHTTFPYRNIFSYMLGPLIVYPALKRKHSSVLEKVVGGIAEVYHCNDPTEPHIEFIMPTEKAEQFQPPKEE